MRKSSVPVSVAFECIFSNGVERKITFRSGDNKNDGEGNWDVPNAMDIEIVVFSFQKREANHTHDGEHETWENRFQNVQFPGETQFIAVSVMSLSIK